jgi:polysaccharide export outer membrane protein
MHLIRFILVLALAVCAPWSWAQSSTAPVAPAAPPADYKLGPGDAIRVQVFQNPDLTVEARVSESGSIRYPLVGSVDIGGLSIGQAEAKVADALRAGQFLKAPQVNIVLLQVRGNQVSVLGQVNRPGRFPLETFNVRVSDMLAAAGGVTPTGDDSLVVSGTRNNRPFRKVIDIPALFSNIRGPDDIVLAAGDTIYVNNAPIYYIYGEAQKPGSYRVQRGMTVMQALAQGGGPTARGSQNRLRLDRTQPDGSVVQITPRLTDPVQPGDVLFVRESIF